MKQRTIIIYIAGIVIISLVFGIGTLAVLCNMTVDNAMEIKYNRKPVTVELPPFTNVRLVQSGNVTKSNHIDLYTVKQSDMAAEPSITFPADAADRLDYEVTDDSTLIVTFTIDSPSDETYVDVEFPSGCIALTIPATAHIDSLQTISTQAVTVFVRDFNQNALHIASSADIQLIDCNLGHLYFRQDSTATETNVLEQIYNDEWTRHQKSFDIKLSSCEIDTLDLAVEKECDIYLTGNSETASQGIFTTSVGCLKISGINADTSMSADLRVRYITLGAVDYAPGVNGRIIYLTAQPTRLITGGAPDNGKTSQTSQQ